MNLAIDGERRSVQVYLDGRIHWKGFYRSGMWTREHFHFSRKGSVWLSTPLFHVDARVEAWSRDESEQPKYSRPKRLMVTFEHGLVKGYKE